MFFQLTIIMDIWRRIQLEIRDNTYGDGSGGRLDPIPVPGQPGRYYNVLGRAPEESMSPNYSGQTKNDNRSKA
jgi:hypothetical protein